MFHALKDLFHALKGLLLLVPLAMLAATMLPVESMAAPMGGQVTAGSGSITHSGEITTIQQSSQHLSLNWKSFNVAPSETVNFQQPNTQAIAVNRILDINGSRIMGHLNANGQIYLINPNGILFGKSAQVNVGGLVASTLNISDAALGKANQTFAGKGAGEIVNNGVIHASNGGYVALLGNRVMNNGVIVAKLGTVGMGAGDQVTLSFNGNRLLQLRVNKSVLDSLAANHGLIQADGGIVAMNAGARDALLASVVNSDGIVQARTVQNHNGKIVLMGGMVAGTTNVAGTLDASAPNGGDGGFIETSAAQVKVADTAKITTRATSGQSGTWLIDPKDFTIAASGGDMTGSTLSANLGGGNVAIASTSGSTGTAGDININDTVTWSANTLTLSAQNNININSAMNGSVAAKLALRYGQGAVAAGNTSTYNVNAAVNLSAGNHFSTQLGSNGTLISYTVITELGAAGSTTGTDLQGMNGSLATNYALGANIDATATSGWNTNAGFTPVGSSWYFTGIFDGLGHTIRNLTINSSSTSQVGLFGRAGSGAILRNIGLVDDSVTGKFDVGGLVGFAVSNSTISDSYATGNVTGAGNVGGLIGYAYANSTISNSYATGNVAAGTGGYAGGLVGFIRGSTIISDSYATGNVTGTVYLGGLVGYTYEHSTISNSYATGNVTGTGGKVGGLVGSVDSSGAISNSYATGRVTGTNNLGGLVGLNNGPGITSSYWNIETSNQTTSSNGGVGLTTAQMQQESKFTGFDFTNNWIIYNGHTYPLLRSLMTPLTLTADNVSTTYDGLAYAGGLSNPSYSVTGANTSGHLSGLNAPYAGDINAGSYAPGMWSDQQGFIISYTNGRLTVNPATLSASGSQVYNGTTSFSGTNLMVTGVNGESFTASGNGTLGAKNVQTNQALASVAGLTLSSKSGALTTNYNTLSTVDTSVSVTKANLNVTGLTASSKVYNATTAETLGGTAAITGKLLGDAVTLGGAASGSFVNKDVGTAKAVTVTGNTISGADVGNYNLVQQTGLTAAITKAKMNVTGLTASSKVYNATTAEALGGTAAITGKLLGDTVTLGGTAAGTFANKNVGTAKAVTVTGNTISGADVGNYNLVQQTGLTANVTPATLTYSAMPVRIIQAQPLPLFSGTVGGFVGGDVLATATSGSLAWASPARSSNTPGSFVINGSGLTAKNYVFSQAAGNATALTIQPGRAGPSVESVITQAQSFLNHPEYIARGTMKTEYTSGQSGKSSGRGAGNNPNMNMLLQYMLLQSGGNRSNTVLLTVEGNGIHLPKLPGE